MPARATHRTRPLGPGLVAAALAVAALGLQAWPLVAWCAAVALNALAVVAVLNETIDLLVPRRPYAAAAIAAFATASAVLCPALAPRALGDGRAAALACAVFVAALVLWVERCARPAPSAR